MSSTQSESSTSPKRSKKAFDFARGNLFYCKPEELILVTDEDHPLYDARIKMPLREGLVKSIMKRGIVKPIAVRKENDKAIVIDGRQRTRAAVEANKLLKAEGAKESELIRVPFIVRRPDDTEAMSIMVELNELSTMDDMATKTAKAQRLLDRGVPVEEIADSFGVGVPSVKNWFKLQECHPKVREAVESGRIRATDAINQIAKLPRNEQVEAIEKIAVANPTRQARKERGEKARKTTSPVSRLKKVAEAREGLGIEARVVIDWIMGDATKETLFERYPKLRDTLDKKKKKSKATEE